MSKETSLIFPNGTGITAYFSGVSKLLASLGHTGRRKVVLGHTLNTLQHVITKKSHAVLSKFMISFWAMGWTPLLQSKLQPYHRSQI